MFASEGEVVEQWRSFVPVVRVCAAEWRVFPCCSSPVAVKLHWYKRRSVPCVASACACPACVTPPRPLLYLGCRIVTDRETLPVRVLELPVSAWSVVKQQASACGGLLRFSFRVFRHGGKRGKVLVDQFEEAEGLELLTVVEVVNALCRLWNVPAPRVGELDGEWLTRVGVAIACDGHYQPK